MSDEQPKPKLLIRRQSMFYEETFTNPAGVTIRVKRIQTTRGTHFTVSVDGKRVDSFLTLALARAKAKTLFNTRGTIL